MNPSSETSPFYAHPHLVLKRVGINFGHHQVLNNIDLTLNTSDRLGVVGDNGQGKTTLLSIIAGTLEPSSGTVTRHGTLALAEQTIAADLTVAELSHRAIAASLSALRQLDQAAEALTEDTPGSADAYDAALTRATELDAWDAQRRLDQALQRLKAVHPQETLLSTLSLGQRHRVWLACLLGGDHDFIVLDEPTNHLDADALEFLTESLQTRSGGVVVVSHDRALLTDVTTRILDLDPTPDGNPRLYGGYHDYVQGRTRMEQSWIQDFNQQQSERQVLEDQLAAAQDRLISGWRPPKGTGKHQRATRAGANVKQVHRRTAALEGHAVDVPPPPLELRFPELGQPESQAAQPLLKAEQVSAKDRLSEPTNLELAMGSRLLVVGPNGAGKSSLLSILAEKISPSTGSITRRSATDKFPAAAVGFLPQESELPPLKLVHAYFESTQPKVSLEELGLLDPIHWNKQVGELSVGQQRRLHLAVVLAQKPNVLLLDEPTNHLSARLVEQLTVALENTGATVVVVTHDRQLLRDFSGWPRKVLEG